MDSEEKANKRKRIIHFLCPQVNIFSRTIGWLISYKFTFNIKKQLKIFKSRFRCKFPSAANFFKRASFLNVFFCSFHTVVKIYDLWNDSIFIYLFLFISFHRSIFVLVINWRTSTLKTNLNISTHKKRPSQFDEL